MAYSSVAQFRSNIPRIPIGTMADAAVEDRIDFADDQVEVDLSKVVDFTLVTDTPAGCPTFINKLSQYKTAEMCCVSKFGAKRMVEEQSDRQYWERMYNDLLKAIMASEIDLDDVGFAGMDYTNDVKNDVQPALGMGEEGEYVNETDNELIRATYGNASGS